jgi:Alpha/beta hydrolase domain
MLACTLFSRTGCLMPDDSLSVIEHKGNPLVAGTLFDLSSVGYEQSEYRFSGTAQAYEQTSEGVRPREEAEFATRLIVYRPSDERAFNGTVWIEWHNVSGGFDAAPGWIFTHRELIRSGAAWVGVSAQKIGVDGGTSLLGIDGVGLVGTNPQRYGSLHHPGDRFSYDIFTQASAVVREVTSETILGGLRIDRVIATGDSQSGFRLTRYVNEIDPLTRVHDGFMIHARGCAAAPLDDDQDPRATIFGEPVLFRDDLRVPVMCVESETDLINLRYLEARQDDSENLTVWEMAGTSHADVYTFIVGMRDDGRSTTDELAKLWAPPSEIFGLRLDYPVNAGPQHYIRNAAVRSLERWISAGVRPPESERLAMSDGAFVADANGNVKGGIRTPHVDVPRSVLTGLGNSGSPISFLCGRTLPLEPARLEELHKSKEDYLERFAASTDQAVGSGFMLEDDAAEINGIAAANTDL